MVLYRRFPRYLALVWPILMEPLSMAPRGSMPPNLCAASDVKNMEAMHPQDAIRISAKLIRGDVGLQVRRQGLSREREYTILRTVWWRGKLPNDRLGHA